MISKPMAGRSTLAAFALYASLLAPWSQFLDRLFEMLTPAAAAMGTIDGGCLIDPDGGCLDQPEQHGDISPDGGCVIDPDGGRCLPEQSALLDADGGCGIDPDGCRR